MEISYTLAGLFRFFCLSIISLVLYYFHLKKRIQSKKFKFIFLTLVLIFISLYIDFIIYKIPIWKDLIFWNINLFHWCFLFFVISLTILIPIFIFSNMIQLVSKQIISEENISSRKNFLSKLIKSGLILVDYSPLIGVSGFLTGTLLGSREILIKNISIKLENLHDDLKGFKISHITDIHIGTSVNQKFLEFSLEKLSKQKSDILVITGDMIDFSNYYLNIFAWYIQKLSQIFQRGIYISLGNHDYFDSIKEFIQVIKKLPAILLRNDSILIQRGKGKLILGGLDWPWPMMGHSENRFKASRNFYNNLKIPKEKLYPFVLLNHDPTDFIWLKNLEADLILSGHTHGGQIKILNERNSFLNPIHYHLPYYTGFYKEKNSQLYVNHGLGSTIPTRISCPPEIVNYILS